MFGKDLYIKKYPYMGFSPNIMEYFSIIGYQENFVPTLIEYFKKKKNPFPQQHYHVLLLILIIE